MGCAVYFLSCGVAETLQNNYGHTLHRSANLISIPRLTHFACFVCFGFTCGKYFLIKYLVIKSWLHVWFVWLMSRFSEWDWHSLLTVGAHYAFAGLLLHRDTDGDNKPISAAPFAEGENPHRMADLFLFYLIEPTHCWISAASRSSQPTADSLCDAVHNHQCGGVLS